VFVEQAIFTSLTRLGKSGYHVVARSQGLSESDAVALATWSPSHGSLIVDAANRTSVNFHPMPGDRFALSRTCEGPPEFSGRGGSQLYTHALVFDRATLKHAAHQPFAIYRDALALGYLYYRSEPESILKPVALSSLYLQRDREYWAERAQTLGLSTLESLRERLSAGEDVKVPFPGDRAALVECLLGEMDDDAITHLSFTTSLKPSAVRPYRLLVVGAAA
jgi:hypothetical protein